MTDHRMLEQNWDIKKSCTTVYITNQNSNKFIVQNVSIKNLKKPKLITLYKKYIYSE